MKRPALLIMLALSALTACDLGKVTVNTTSKVLVRAQPAMKQEADYLLASRAIPGALKTVEGFHYVDPENERLKGILAEGFCQYATGFVEDEWEIAVLAGDLEEAELHSDRATKAFFRCMGYALEMLGGSWKQAILGDSEVLERMIAKVGWDDRNALLWAAVGLAGAINQNKDDPGMIANVAKAQLMLERVIALDDRHGQGDAALRAIPHMALAMVHLGKPEALGGDPALGKKHFERAIDITGGRYLLPKVYLARRYAVSQQDAALFRQVLTEVLRTDPAIWPEQRLANEIAHRRAHRYLKNEKEWF